MESMGSSVYYVIAYTSPIADVKTVAQKNEVERVTCQKSTMVLRRRGKIRIAQAA